MKERGGLSRVGVNTGKVGAFVKITFGAGKGEVLLIIRAAVLTSDNMFDVKPKRGKILGESAVFATISGTLADQLDRRSVPQAGLV